MNGDRWRTRSNRLEQGAAALDRVLTDEPERLDLVLAHIAAVDPSREDTGTELVEEVVAAFDQLADDAVRAGIVGNQDGSPDAATLVAHVFQTLGFVGNTSRYYDPDNSLIHRVLARRRGIPLSLAVVAAEVSRRVGGRLTVVGFPGHVLVGDELTPGHWFDPFAAGAAVDQERLRTLLATFHPGADLRPEMTLPMSAGDVAARTLNNLAGAYRQLGMLSRMVDVYTFRCHLESATVGDQLQLAGALAATGRYHRAANWFELLRELDPDNAASHRAMAARFAAHRN